MATVRLAKDVRRLRKQSSKPAVKEVRAVRARAVKAKFVMSDAEKHLRKYLVYKKKIKNLNDDKGLYNWIDSMRKGDDARTKWEKDLQARLARELGLPIQ